jgi:SAM-dependent methyltransferase
MTAQAGGSFATAYVPESRFGTWFQRTDIWRRYVLEEATRELVGLLPPGTAPVATVIDAGCGEGLAFGLLRELLGARSIVGVDIDAHAVAAARGVRVAGADARVLQGDASRLPLGDATADVVFCHQLLHHANDAAGVLRELRRVLRPGGWLLVAESCRSFIEWWPVRLLFRHPGHSQRTAEGYVELVRAAGFDVPAQGVLTPAPFWSEPLVALARTRGRTPRRREPGQVRIAARK